MSAGYFSYSIAAKGRAEGFNAVLHSAYITGRAVYDETEHELYTWGSQERVLHSEILTPEDAPLWLEEAAKRQDSAALWNRVERAEYNQDGSPRMKAQLYRSVVLSIDDGLFVYDSNGDIDLAASRELQARLVREHIRENFLSLGMTAQWALHWDLKAPNQNPHAHIMLPTRAATEDGFSKHKNGQTEPKGPRPWAQNRAEQWRKSWQDIQNRELERLGLNYRVDHRSYERQLVELEPEQKHFGSYDKQQENAAHHQLQAERLIKNPRPLFDLMNGVFVTPFREADIIRFVQRFAKDDAQQKALLARVMDAPELVHLPNDLYTTQGKLAEKARGELEPVLERLDALPSWAILDKRLAQQGWQLEAVQRDGRLVYDLAKRSDPTARVSAYRVDKRFSPAACGKRFGQDRAAYELKAVATQTRRPFRQQRDAVWERHRELTAAEQERLDVQVKAIGGPKPKPSNDNRFAAFQRRRLARELNAVRQQQAQRRADAKAFTAASKAAEERAVEKALAAKRLDLRLSPANDTPTAQKTAPPPKEGPDMPSWTLPRHPAELDSLMAEKEALDREIAKEAVGLRLTERYKELVHQRNSVTERILTHPDHWTNQEAAIKEREALEKASYKQMERQYVDKIDQLESIRRNWDWKHGREYELLHSEARDLYGKLRENPNFDLGSIDKAIRDINSHYERGTPRWGQERERREAEDRTPSPAERERQAAPPPIARHPLELKDALSRLDEVDRSMNQARQRGDAERFAQLSQEKSRLAERIDSHPDFTRDVEQGRLKREDNRQAEPEAFKQPERDPQQQQREEFQKLRERLAALDAEREKLAKEIERHPFYQKPAPERSRDEQPEPERRERSEEKPSLKQMREREAWLEKNKGKASRSGNREAFASAQRELATLRSSMRKHPDYQREQEEKDRERERGKGDRER